MAATPPVNTASIPRNAKLSAYYNLGKPKSSSSSESPANGTELPTTGGRNAVIEHAKHLTQTLSLADLMTRSSELRHQADRLSTSLQASSRGYYTHLRSSAEAAHSAVEVAQNLLSSPSENHNGVLDKDITVPDSSSQTSVIDSVASYTGTCAEITERLALTRQRVDALHAVQRLAALLQVSMDLASSLPSIFEAATGLCTEPASARSRLFTAARRFAAVAPTVAALSVHSPEFTAASESLSTAGTIVRKSLCSLFFPLDGNIQSNGTSHIKDEDDSGEEESDVSNDAVLSNIVSENDRTEAENDDDSDTRVLSLVDAVQLRFLLGERPADVRADFLRSVSRYIAAPYPTPAAISAAGALRPAVARLHTVYCSKEVVPRLLDAARWYADLFINGDKNEDTSSNDEWSVAMVCLSAAADDAIAVRVRRALHGPPLQEIEVKALPTLLLALRSLPEGTEGGRDEPDIRTGDVIQAITDGLISFVDSIARDAARAHLRKAVEPALNVAVSGSADDAVRNVVAAQKEVVAWGSGSVFNNSEAWAPSVVSSLLSEVLERQDIKTDVAFAARAARLCDVLSSDTPVLDESAERLRDFAKAAARKAAVNPLRTRVEAVCGANYIAEGIKDDTTLNEALRALQNAEAIARECDIAALRKPRDGDADAGVSPLSDEDAFLDEGWLGRAVARDWVAAIRKTRVPSPFAIHELQADAAELTNAIGYNIVREVGNAARSAWLNDNVAKEEIVLLDGRQALDRVVERKS